MCNHKVENLDNFLPYSGTVGCDDSEQSTKLKIKTAALTSNLPQFVRDTNSVLLPSLTEINQLSISLK